MGFLKDKTLGFFVKTGGIFSQYLFGGIGLVFMLHRVLPNKLKKRYTINEDLAITPEFLEQTIVSLKQRDFRFISLDELHLIIQTGKKPNKKCICITLDDGYRDNVIYGLPIFKKHEVPFTIYVSNCLPNKKAHFWWYWLEEKLHIEEKLIWKGISYSTKTEAEKNTVFNLIRESIKNASQTKRLEYAQEFFGKTDLEIELESTKLGLSWEELNELKNEPLATIGAHTMHHLSLAYQTNEDMIYEIKKSKIELEDKLKIQIEHFAYPFGSIYDAKNREFEMTNKIGFKTATLNHPGNTFLSNKKSLMSLARYPLGNSTTEEKMDQYINGISHFAENGWKKNIK